MVPIVCILAMGQRNQNKNTGYNILYFIKQTFAFKYPWYLKKLMPYKRFKRKKGEKT